MNELLPNTPLHRERLLDLSTGKSIAVTELLDLSSSEELPRRVPTDDEGLPLAPNDGAEATPTPAD